MAVTADEIDDLLGEEELTNADYTVLRRLEQGEVTSFMGFDFIPYEDWDDNAEGRSIPRITDSPLVRRCPVWLNEGMHFGSWAGLMIVISDRPDKNHIKQAFATFTAGSTRLEEDKVFEMQTSRTA